MQVNVLIGVGGTGAKIIESSLFLMSAGFGPEGSPVHVGVVDQDNSNGNVQRTEALLRLIADLQADFDQPANKIDREKSGEAPELFSVPVRPLFGASGHWRPAEDDQSTLRDILRRSDMPRGEQALFDLLYRGEGAAPAEAEQTMDLAEGYRGRAHVGAAALVCALEYDSPDFLDQITRLMRETAAGNEVRIFITGSLFGGTGAAGFPTIARVLHRLRAPKTDAERQRANGINGDKVSIGGALMLPYFQFGDPASPEANVIRTAQLLPQARVAVEFYETLLEQERVFDRLYVAGWDTMFQLNYHQPGREAQRNPALLPELIAALAASHFLRGEKPDRTGAPRPYAAARASAETIGWGDLPLSDEERLELYKELGGAFRFALYWRYRLDEALDRRGLFGGSRGWVGKLTPDVDWRTTGRAIRDRLNTYSEALLGWASSMRLFAGTGVRDFALWHGERIWQSRDLSQPANPIVLQPQRSEEETFDDLNGLLTLLDPSQASKDRVVDARVVYSDLNEIDGRQMAHRGFGRLVTAVHRATQPFREQG
ncbi:hypothetical protein [Sphingomonas sp. NPDC079357]|uniref:hypothetical protein n=1 Tax=Sphingomonas sp. NPDC079357 TaxID=3364518 RepID=UPI00384F5BD7